MNHANEIATPEARITRGVMIWLNSFPELPEAVDAIRYERLWDDSECMAVSAVQGERITHRYIGGGYEAEYSFKLIYRLKPGAGSGARLDADELLERLGSWAGKNRPELGTGIRVRRVEPITRAAVTAAYDNGDEDHQITIKIMYEAV